MPDVSAIVTVHAEGKLIIPSVRSCMKAAALLAAEGYTVEPILVMDRPNAATRTEVKKMSTEFDLKVEEFDYGDQGAVRNHVVSLAQGKYVAFLDGDDLWSENWLLAAHNKALELPPSTVLYPEFNWFFEGSNNILCQVDDSAEWFDIESLRTVNLWDALCFCPKEIYKKIPFSKRKIAEGFAYEDWNWNRKVFEEGISQRIVKDTIIFKRRRAESQSAHAQKRGVLAQPSTSCYYDFY